jgi:hypothetical protein
MERLEPYESEYIQPRQDISASCGFPENTQSTEMVSYHHMIHERSPQGIRRIRNPYAGHTNAQDLPLVQLP